MRHLGAPRIAQQDGKKPYSAGPGGSLDQHMWTDAQPPPSYFEPKPLEETQVDSPAPETPVAGAVPLAMSTPPTAPTIPSPEPPAIIPSQSGASVPAPVAAPPVPESLPLPPQT